MQQNTNTTDGTTRAVRSNKLRGEVVSTSLTQRELQILTALSKAGASQQSVAEEFCISRETVHVHMRNIRRKLGKDRRHSVLTLFLQAA
jgi:DNA-binding NarL/FixJ family response regulator